MCKLLKSFIDYIIYVYDGIVIGHVESFFFQMIYFSFSSKNNRLDFTPIKLVSIKYN